MSITEDKKLLTSLQTGQSQAFTTFDKTHRRWLEFVAMTILRDPEQAQEIVQEFLIDFWNQEMYNSLTIYTDKSLKNFLFISVKNRCLNFIEKDHVRQKRFEDVLKFLPDTYTRPANILENKQLKERLTEAIETLPEGQRRVFDLAYLGDKTRKDIAALLDIGEETVKTQISRALKTLRAFLENEKYL